MIEWGSFSTLLVKSSSIRILSDIRRLTNRGLVIRSVFRPYRGLEAVETILQNILISLFEIISYLSKHEIFVFGLICPIAVLANARHIIRMETHCYFCGGNTENVGAMEKILYSLDEKVDYYLHKIAMVSTLRLDPRDLYEVDVLDEETYLIDQVMI